MIPDAPGFDETLKTFNAVGLIVVALGALLSLVPATRRFGAWFVTLAGTLWAVTLLSIGTWFLSAHRQWWVLIGSVAGAGAIYRVVRRRTDVAFRAALIAALIVLPVVATIVSVLIDGDASSADGPT